MQIITDHRDGNTLSTSDGTSVEVLRQITTLGELVNSCGIDIWRTEEDRLWDFWTMVPMGDFKNLRKKLSSIKKRSTIYQVRIKVMVIQRS